MPLGTKIVINRPSQEIDVLNTVHDEVLHEELQYTG